MLWISKKAKVTCFCVLIPMFLITVFWGVLQQNKLNLFVSVGFLVFFSYIIRRFAAEELKAVNAKLADELETQEYITFFEYAVKSKFANELSLQMKSLLMTGYLAIGDFAKAEPLFYELMGYLNIPASAEKYINPLSACTNYLIYTEQYNEAYALILKLSEYNKLLPEKFEHMDAVYNVLRIKYLCVTNQLNNIEDFNNVYEKTLSLYNKVQLKYFLGCYYENINDYAQAVVQFEFVKTNAKDLYISELANAKLQNQS